MSDLLAISPAFPAMVLIDLPSPADQISAIEMLSMNRSDAIAVVLAESFNFQTMVACFARGACGYMVKNVSAPSLLAFLRLVALGHKVMPPELAEHLQREPSSYGDQTSANISLEDAGLSRREEEVLGHLVAGQPNKSIARNLDVSDATVKVHVKAILRKLHLANRTQAALWGNTHLSRTSSEGSIKSLGNGLKCASIDNRDRPEGSLGSLRLN